MNANEDTACKTEDKLKKPGENKVVQIQNVYEREKQKNRNKTSDTPQKFRMKRNVTNQRQER